MFSISQNSQRPTPSPYSVLLPISRHVHSFTASASASEKPTLPTEPCCQDEEDHERRQSDAIVSYEEATKSPTRLYQHSLIPALRSDYRTEGVTPNLSSWGDALSSWSGIQEEETREANVEFNSPARQDSLLLDPDFCSIPPSPLDLSALHDTWEHVRAYCNNMTTAVDSKSGTHASIGKISPSEVLSPRNIRIQSDWNHLPDLYTRPKAIWQSQRDDARFEIAAQKQLEDDGIWMCKETATTTRRIECRIARLTLNHPTVEAEWSVHFWQEFFFKHGNDSPSQLIEKFVERRQLHSESYRDAIGKVGNNPDDRLPSVVSTSRHSVPVSAEPWIMTKFNRRGYAFSDILYATTTPVDLTSADDIQRYPGIRLFRDSFHLAAGFTVEVKPLNPDGSIGKDTRDHAIRYSTLTASIMLHEELKLCYLASDDDDFFPEPDHLNNHFFAAVGHKAYHFIHCLRHPEPYADIIYESYFLGEYDLSYALERETFRRTINQIYVYQITTLRNVELGRLRKILALDPEIRKHRLETRIHKYIRFSYDYREGVRGFKVHDDSPDDRKSEHAANHHEAAKETVPALDADNPPNSMDGLFRENQVDVSTLDLSLPDANSKTRRAQDLDSAFEPRREENAVVDLDGAMKARRPKKKLCGSTNTATGKPCKLHSDGAGCHIAGHRVER